MIDPKPAARVRDRGAGWEKIISEGKCRACPSRYRLHRHHLVHRGLGGGDVDDNLVPLCDRCHERFHAAKDGRHTVGALIRRTLSPLEEYYVTSTKSVAFLDRYYPRMVAA